MTHLLHQLNLIIKRRGLVGVYMLWEDSYPLKIYNPCDKELSHGTGGSSLHTRNIKSMSNQYDYHTPRKLLDRSTYYCCHCSSISSKARTNSLIFSSACGRGLSRGTSWLISHTQNIDSMPNPYIIIILSTHYLISLHILIVIVALLAVKLQQFHYNIGKIVQNYYYYAYIM